MSINDVLQRAVGQITDFQSWIDQQANRFIVQPGTARGISGFVFNVKTDDRIELRADITDYVVEDNSYVNDHIALKPLTITLSGFMGEIKNEVEVGLPGALNTIQNKLSVISEYLPERSISAIQSVQKALNGVQNFVTDANNAIKKTQNLLETVSVWSTGNTVQEQAFSKLMGMFRDRSVVTVETPWGYLDNMAITSVVMEQDGKTKEWSDISVSLKQLQFAHVEEFSANAFGRAGEMISSIIDKGKVMWMEVLSLATAPFNSMPSGPVKGAMAYQLDPDLNNIQGYL